MGDRMNAFTPKVMISTVVPAVLAGIAMLLYAGVLDAPFVFDDRHNIVDNPHIRLTDFSLERITDVVRSPSGNRPVANLTFALNYYFGRYNPAGYHQVNILVHVLTALLLFLVLQRTLALLAAPAPWAAAAGALLWLVHPLHTQSVTYVVQRMNALAAMFCMLALICYIKARLLPSGRTVKGCLLWSACGIAVLLALATKETAATLPVIIFLYEWFFFQNLDRAWLKKQLPSLAVAGLILVIITLVYTGGHPLEKLGTMYGRRGFSPVQRLLTEPGIIIYYLTLLAWPDPARLIVDYDFPLLSSPASMSFLLPLAAVSAALAAAILAVLRHRLVSFTVIWFFMNLVIESSVVGLAPAFEHRTYLPSMFPLAVTGILLVRRVQPRYLAAGLVCLAVGLFGWWTLQRNRFWQDELRLWRDNVEKTPVNSRSYGSLGMAQYRAGDYNGAVANLETALQLDTNPSMKDEYLAQTLMNLGMACEALGDLHSAVSRLEQALRIYSSLSGDHQSEISDCANNLGIVYTGLGDFSQAKAWLEKALADRLRFFGPDSAVAAETYLNLGVLYEKTGDYAVSLAFFEKSLAVRRAIFGANHPATATALNNIGLIYLRTGDYNQAIAFLRRGLDIRERVLGPGSPETADACNNLGAAYQKDGAFEKALPYYKRAAQIRLRLLGPEHPGTIAIFRNLLQLHEKLGNKLQKQGDLSRARPHFVRSYEILKRQAGLENPQTLFAGKKLGALYAALGDYDNAGRCLSEVLAAAYGVLGQAHPFVQELMKDIDYINRRQKTAPPR